MIGVIAQKMAELHNSSDHKAFRAAFTTSAQEPESQQDHGFILTESQPNPRDVLKQRVIRSQALTPTGKPTALVRSRRGVSLQRAAPVTTR